MSDPDFIVAYLKAELERNPVAFMDLSEYVRTYLTGMDIEVTDWQIKVADRWLSMPIRDPKAAAQYDAMLAGVIVP